MSALLSLIQNIQTLSQQLFECLTLEKQALDDNQLTELTEISTQKQSLLEQLDTLDKQRIANSSAKDFNALIENSKNPALIEQWSSTRQSIAACQQQNEINGRLLSKRNQLNQEILSILSGRSQTTAETYDAQGNQTGNTSLLAGIKA